MWNLFRRKDKSVAELEALLTHKEQTIAIQEETIDDLTDEMLVLHGRILHLEEELQKSKAEVEARG